MASTQECLRRVLEHDGDSLELAANREPAVRSHGDPPPPVWTPYTGVCTVLPFSSRPLPLEMKLLDQVNSEICALKFTHAINCFKVCFRSGFANHWTPPPCTKTAANWQLPSSPGNTQNAADLDLCFAVPKSTKLIYFSFMNLSNKVKWLQFLVRLFQNASHKSQCKINQNVPSIRHKMPNLQFCTPVIKCILFHRGWKGQDFSHSP